MLIPVGYDRFRAVAYALRWALSRNPRYYDFDDIGGDCTNFVSQCLFAGCCVMNYAPENGWYFISPDDRAPSWTSVELLQRFLLNNGGAGPYGVSADLSELRPGDVIQLRNADGRLYHSLIISYIFYPAVPENIFICSHSYDSRNRRLSAYSYAAAEGIRIVGARRELPAT